MIMEVKNTKDIGIILIANKNNSLLSLKLNLVLNLEIKNKSIKKNS